jgi:futalosine hydrolase
MYLLVAATHSEIAGARSLISPAAAAFLVTGMGPVEAALSLTRHLSTVREPYRAIINIGTAGAFVDTGLGLLDLCLATREVLGDLGICFGDRIEAFAPSLPAPREFDLTGALQALAGQTLAGAGISCRSGTFVTVSCVSGTRARGDELRDLYGAICENMEGAALARVCQVFGIPFLELRCVSNMVEERNTATWRLAEASQRICATVSQLLQTWEERR